MQVVPSSPLSAHRTPPAHAVPVASAGAIANLQGPHHQRRLAAALGSLAAASAAAGAAARRRQVLHRPTHDRQCARLVALKAAVTLEAATVRCGADIVLNDVDLEVSKGARAAILGPNGCGKSTLLRTLAGIIVPETGDVLTEAKSLAWLRQEATAGSTATVMEEATAEMCQQDNQKKLDEAAAALETAATPEEIDAAMAAYEKASEEFEACGGYEMDQQATKVLQGLGFTSSDFDRPCSELSGGWQMKVALARALLKDGDLLLLDEPTNHMDTSAKEWLGAYLAEDLPKSTTLIVVTHDRFLLERIQLNTVVEISEKNIMKFNVPSIEKWQEERKRLSEKLGKDIKELEKQIATDTAWAQKWGAKTAFATKAQSRMKAVARMKVRVNKLKEMTRGLPADEVLAKDKKGEGEEGDGMLPLADAGNVNLQLPDAPLRRGGPPDGVLLKLHGGEIGYGDRPAVLSEIELLIKAGARIALLGPNGAGKTTLLRHLLGSMALRGGTRELGEGSGGEASVALFTQDLAQDLPSDVSPIDYVLSEGGSEQVARATLGALGLKSNVHKSMIGTLSGGEKARVALAVFATTPTDVLLLDEPTNHLDRVAVTALANGLKTHTGAVLVSTHDQAFVDALEITHKAIVTKSQDGVPGTVQLVSIDDE